MVTTDSDHLRFSLLNKYAAQECAWMDTPTMHIWTDQVYGPWALRVNGPSMVLLYLGQEHAKQEIVDCSAEFQSYVELRPAHSTSVLQLMDVGINMPFKNDVRMSTTSRTRTTANTERKFSELTSLIGLRLHGRKSKYYNY
jgi:DDE superfamily endonuclease